MGLNMKKHNYCILFILFSSYFFSCSTGLDTQKLENSLNSWLYYDKAELVRSWGPPSRIESDQNGGQIFIYDQSSKEKTEGMVWTNPKTGMTTYTTPEEYTMYLVIMMYVNPQGKIYHWKYDTNY